MADKIEIQIDGQDNAKGAFASVNSGIGGIVKSALGLAAGVAGFEALKDGVKDVIAAASQAQLVTAQTQAVIKSTGDASGLSAEQVHGMAEELSRTEPIDPKVIQSGENMLLTFTNIGKDVFPQATQATLDMSTALGEDSTQAALQLGKALNDPVQGVTALQRVGVKLTDAQKEQVKAMVASGNTMGAQKLILGELTREFGGSAEAAGKTFPGQLKILGSQLDTLKENIGLQILPLMVNLGNVVIPLIVRAFSLVSDELPRLISYLTDQLAPAFQKISGFIVTQIIPNLLLFSQWFMTVGLPAIQQFAQAVQQFVVGQVIPAFQQIGAVVLPILERVIGFLENNWRAVLVGAGAIVLAVIVPAFVAWAAAAATAAVATIVALAPVIAIMAAIGIAAGALYLAWSSNFLNIRGIVASVWAFVKPVLDAIALNLQTFVTSLLPKFAAAWQTVQATMRLVQTVLTTVFTAIAGFITQHSQQIMTVLGGAWQFISGIIRTDVALIEGIIKTALDLIGGNWSQAWADIKATLNTAWADMKTAVQGAVAAIGLLLQQAIPALAADLAQWGQQFVAWVAPQVPPLLAELGNLLAQLGSWLVSTALPAIVANLLAWGQAFVAWVAPQIPPLLVELGSLLLSITGWILGTALPAAVSALAQLAAKFVSWVATDVLPNIPGALNAFAVAVGGFIVTTALPAAVTALATLARAFIEWVATDVLPALPGALAAINSTIAGWAAGATSWAAGALAGIGKALIQGLIDGVESMLGSLTGELSKVTSMIPLHKGPIEKDRQLLTPSGQAIMGGLMAGIASQTPALQAQLAGVSSLVGGAALGPSGARSAPAAPGARGTATNTRVTHLHGNINVYPQTVTPLDQLLRGLGL